VHAPEFAFEKNEANVRRAVKDLGITYPVALDNDYAIWQAFANQYWPAHYFIDAQGRIRHHHFGEGDYAGSEKVIQQLLKEAGQAAVPGGIAAPQGAGAEAAPDMDAMQSPETYVGYARAQNFASGPARQDTAATYETPFPLAVNQWGLSGDWTIGREKAVLARPGGAITFRFHARDLHLVMGADHPVRFRVSIDGHRPGADHGVDTDADGNGVVQGQRLYQLIRQRGDIQDRTFRIEFLDPGVEAFSFTFG
jgi:hypothetical protein